MCFLFISCQKTRKRKDLKLMSILNKFFVFGLEAVCIKLRVVKKNPLTFDYSCLRNSFLSKTLLI